MSDALKIRRTKPLTILLNDLLAMQVSEPMRRRLAGLRIDTGQKKRGRPKKGSLELPPNSTFGSALVLALVTRALTGDTMACKLVVHMIEGLPTRSIQFSASSADSLDSSIILEKLQKLFSPRPAAPEPAEIAGSIPHV